MKKFMKKLLIFVFMIVLLYSCVNSMGGPDRYWIVDKVNATEIRGSKNAIYVVKSYDVDGYEYQGFKFEDVQGKFQVGDTVKLVLNNK